MNTPPFKHPETLPGEIYMGNCDYPTDFLASGWKTKRVGWAVYYADGTRPKNPGTLRPWFIQRDEVAQTIANEKEDDVRQVLQNALNRSWWHVPC